MVGPAGAARRPIGQDLTPEPWCGLSWKSDIIFPKYPGPMDEHYYYTTCAHSRETRLFFYFGPWAPILYWLCSSGLFFLVASYLLSICSQVSNPVTLRRERLPGRIMAVFKEQNRYKEMYAVAARIWRSGIPLQRAICIAQEAYDQTTWQLIVFKWDISKEFLTVIEVDRKQFEICYHHKCKVFFVHSSRVTLSGGELCLWCTGSRFITESNDID